MLIGVDAKTTCDSDIRPFLRQQIAQRYQSENGVLFIEEFPLYGGDIRADMVAINGTLHGYEIKSARDTLDRLPRQIEAYGAVFDRASIVVSERHLEQATKRVPDWWEILLVQCVGGGVCFKGLRRGKQNPARDGMAITALLWKAEALAILASHGLEKGMRTATMAKIMETLVEHFSVKQLSPLVRGKLLARGDWLSASRRKPSGETFPRRATLSHPRRTLYSRTSGCTRLPN